MGKITPPELLTNQHQITDFDCGEPMLDEWLKRFALKNQKANASRCFVVCVDKKVIGYYALASGSIERLQVSKSISRNMPDPILVTVLGRLAIDKHFQGLQVGAGLLKDAMLRTLIVSEHIEVKAMLVHAISESAQNFYLQYGFKPCPFNDMTLMLPVTHIKKLLG